MSVFTYVPSEGPPKSPKKEEPSDYYIYQGSNAGRLTQADNDVYYQYTPHGMVETRAPNVPKQCLQRIAPQPVAHNDCVPYTPVYVP
ncbi:MAG: hypothetical protein Q9187_008817, partial [Circinaria calcarea]